MDIIDFYREKKWCEKCRNYVRFLMSIDHSFCVHCGSQVRLFSKKDLEAFHAATNQAKQQQQQQTPRKGRSARAS